MPIQALGILPSQLPPEIRIPRMDSCGFILWYGFVKGKFNDSGFFSRVKAAVVR